ncbi:MAG TPA: hypothetical protein VKT72_02280 [Candidatus Baltobacteraceae bacterium]|nr:hypothetical protein [Candidatus Baltobacteraceae bacterium]
MLAFGSTNRAFAEAHRFDAVLCPSVLDAGSTPRRYTAAQMIHEKTDSRREDAFVIRIWHEAGTANGAPWRATVQHLESGERRFFTNYGELCEFLDRFTRRTS